MKVEIAGIPVQLPDAVIPRGFAGALRPFTVTGEGRARPSEAEVVQGPAGRARGEGPEVVRGVRLETAKTLERGANWHELLRFDFADADADCCFGDDAEGFLLEMTPRNGDPTVRFRTSGTGEPTLCHIPSELHPGLFRFGFWMMFNLAALHRATVAIHASALLYRDRSILFLGESGTGKSTHTRLWRQYIPGASLLNDDSPFIEVSSGNIRAWGSPWSGKLPCYRNEAHPVAAIIRLSQAPENRIRRLRTLEAFGALFPSTPPAFIHHAELREAVCRLLGTIVERIPVYHLACRPDADAARLVCRTLSGDTCFEDPGAKTLTPRPHIKNPNP